MASREGAARLAPAFTEDGEGRVGAFEVFLQFAPAGPLAKGQRQVLLDRQAREHTATLDHVGHAQPGDPVGRKRGDVLAREHDLTRRGRDQSGDRPGHRRLAGSVGPDQCDDASGRHAERHVEEGPVGAVARH